MGTRRRPPSISGLVHVGLDILSTVVNAATKRILVQTGDVVKEATDTDGAEWWQHVGFASRPPKPQAGKQAAQAVVVKTSDRDVVVASVDQRGLGLYGNLDHGETCLYAAGEDGNAQGRVLIKKNGSVSLYTRNGNTSSGAGMTVQLDAENDAIRITNSKGYGIIIDDNGVSITTGGTKAGIKVGSDGTCSMIATGQCQCDGDRIILGATAAPGVNSVCVGPAGIAAAGSSKVFAALA
jgi:hypothetical protein